MTSSAISLRTVEQMAPALVSLYKSAAVSLRKHGLEGGRTPTPCPTRASCAPDPRRRRPAL
ncbi:hypothetical protein ACIGD1_13540 [Streptomyces sp. NPDC085612]|uniref:hypothetical protein n=1 Tax=Streptomyces sp. NPDC085612 TaxID=3365732 RepID=UPI0037D6EA5A